MEGLIETENFSSDLLNEANQTTPTEPMDASEAPQSETPQSKTSQFETAHSLNQGVQCKKGDKNVLNNQDETMEQATVPQFSKAYVRPNKRSSWKEPASSTRVKQLLLQLQ